MENISFNTEKNVIAFIFPEIFLGKLGISAYDEWNIYIFKTNLYKYQWLFGLHVTFLTSIFFNNLSVYE